MATEIVVMTAVNLSLESYCSPLSRCVSRCGTQLSSWITLLTWALCFSPALVSLFSKPVFLFLDCQLLLEARPPRIVSWFSPLFSLVLPPTTFLHLYLQLKCSFLLLCFEFLGDLFFYSWNVSFVVFLFVSTIFFALYSFFSPKVAFLCLVRSVSC